MTTVHHGSLTSPPPESKQPLRHQSYPFVAGLDLKHSEWEWITLPKSDSLPLKIAIPERKVVSQPPCFRIMLVIQSVMLASKSG